MTTGNTRKTIIATSLLIGLLLLSSCTRADSTTDSGPTPADLRPGYQEIYLDLIARAYQADPSLDLDLALGPDWSNQELAITLQAMLDKTPPSESQAVARLRNLATTLDIGLASREGVTLEEEEKSNSFLPLIAGSLLLFVLTVGAAYAFTKIKHPYSPTKVGSPYRVEPTAWRGETEKPLLQFATTYTLGDDHYDTSFSLQSETVEFLGECGLGISATVGKGKPKKATAFEVWLFDKSDVRTVTQVLASQHAYGDQALRDKLGRKGDLVLAQPGRALKFETSTLYIRARIVEMAYGKGDLLPKNSFFEQLKVELAVWQKDN